MDVFIEKLVKRRADTRAVMLRIGIVLAAVGICAVFWLIPPLTSFFPMAFIGCAWGAVTLLRMQDTEYEYAFTNGELDIDKIMEKSRRKRVLTIECGKFDIVAPFTDEYASERSGAAKVLDFAASTDHFGSYFAAYSGKDGKTVLIFDPDDRMLDAIKIHIPSKLKRRA